MNAEIRNKIAPHPCSLQDCQAFSLEMPLEAQVPRFSYNPSQSDQIPVEINSNIFADSEQLATVCDKTLKTYSAPSYLIY